MTSAELSLTNTGHAFWKVLSPKLYSINFDQLYEVWYIFTDSLTDITFGKSKNMWNAVCPLRTQRINTQIKLYVYVTIGVVIV